MMKIDKRGFTLIELLATIAILGIIVTIIIYSAINIVSSLKTRSYQVTVNNIENIASSYVIEDVGSNRWVDSSVGNYQYQCVSVQNLIDAGYFKGDVLESKISEEEYVKPEDQVYLERNNSNKNIDKNILLVGDRTDYLSLCDSISTLGSITFDVKPSDWSKNKEIVITYKLYNVQDNVSNYKSNYNYLVGSSSILSSANQNFTSTVRSVTATVSKNGTMYAVILDSSNKELVRESLIINRLDNDAPTASMTSENGAFAKAKVKLTMKDTGGSGIVKYYFGKTEPSTALDWISVNNEQNLTVNTEANSEGKWYLAVEDASGNRTVIDQTFYKTSLVVSNASVTPNTIITMNGYSFDVPTATPDAYYTFHGWYKSSDFSGTKVTNYKPQVDASLYGKTTENKLAGGVVKISGDAIYGQTLTATVTTDTTPKADSYSYQWYINNTSSTVGGTAIKNATSNTLVLKGAQFDKHIYVVVTANKNNYRNITFSDITDTSNNINQKVGKRSITVTASSKEKVYDGNSLTSNSCSASNLAFSHSVKCTMTSDSKITNVGSVKNKINTISVLNDAKSATINEYYSIINVEGTLTVTKKKATIPTAVSFCKTGLNYTGSSQTITKAAGEGYTFSNNKKLNAGTYTVTATLSTNYIWSDSSTANKTFACSISKIDNTVSVSNFSGTYDGSSHAVVTTTTAKGDVYYSVGTQLTSSNYSTKGSKTIPSRTNAGTYVVYYYAKGNTNYNVASGSLTSTISRKSVAVSWSDTSKIYTSNEQKPSASVTLGVGTETMTLSVTGAKSAAGTHTATASCSKVIGGQATCANYTLTNKTVSFTIGNKKLTVSVSASDKVYDGTRTASCSVTLTGVNSGDNVTVTVKGEFEDSNAENGKEVTCSNIALSSDWTSKYSLDKTSATTTANISKKSIAVNWSGTSKTYNGKNQRPGASVETGVGTETMTLSYTGATKNAGNHTATVSCSAVTGGNAKCSNYTLTSTTKSFTISKVTLTPSVSVSNKIYDGTKTASCVVALTGAVNGEKPTATANGQFNNADVGNNKSATCSSITLGDWGTNYKLSTTSATTSANISTKTVTVLWGNTSLNYNGNNQKPTASVELGVGTETMTLSVTGAKSTAGTHTATASCSAVVGGRAKCTNYTLSNTTTNFVISNSYRVYIRYKANDGVMSNNNSDYTLGSDGYVYKNGSILEDTISYGATIGSSGLYNYNNSDYINLVKNGYSAVTNKEWKCISGCTTSSKEFNQNTATYTSNDFCDASSNSCTVTLGVNWIGNTYTISFVSNGGYSSRAADNKSYCSYNGGANHDISGSMTSTTCRYGSTCTLPSNGFTRQCHEFKGWTTNSDTDATNYTGSITNNSTNSSDAFYANQDSFIYNTNGNMTLYAVWKSAHKFDYSDGALGIQLYESGGKFECGHVHTEAYARYCSVCQMSVAHYNLCYLPAYKEEGLATQYCPCGAAWSGKSVLNDHKYFNFTGSTIEPEGKSKLKSFGGIVEGKTKMVVSSSSVQNVCKEHPVLINYNGNGGTPATSSANTYEYASITLPTPSRSGYTFNGWYTSSSGGNKVGGAGDSYYVNDGNITLYAQWIINRTVTFNANGGSVSPSSKTVASGGSITLPTPSRSGYTFSGWYTSSSGGTYKGGAGSSYTVDSNITLYAHWTVNKKPAIKEEILKP